MGNTSVKKVIRTKFGTDKVVNIPLLIRDKTFTAELSNDGVIVNNLGSQPFLSWLVFEEAVNLIKRNDGRAKRGDAMNFKLGESGLPIDSIEGHIARTIYGKKCGDSVFRRITPIACILIWAGICKSEPGELVIET